MTPWKKEKLARAVMEELEPHASGAWFTPQAIVRLEKFNCTEDMALMVFADLVKRRMLVSSPFQALAPSRDGQLQRVYVSAWSVSDEKRREIRDFIHNGGIWHMYVTPTIKWFWGISRYRLLVVASFCLAALVGGFLSEAGKSFWGKVKWWEDAPSQNANP